MRAGAVQYPLFQLLAPWQEIAVPTCVDTSYIHFDGYGTKSCDFDYRSSHGYSEIGIDLEPAQMAIIPVSYVLPRIRAELATMSTNKVQPHLWEEFDVLYRRARTVGGLGRHAGFVAGIPAGTTTGVLREHIMRLNSSVSCTALATSDYPSTCPGTNPFQASFDYVPSYYSQYNATVDICAPGAFGVYPWTLSRDRQELSEDLFLKFTGAEEGNEVLHCTAQTTRGYFELGNVYSGGTFGHLLERWPREGPPLYDYQFNDYFPIEFGPTNHTQGYIPSEE